MTTRVTIQPLRQRTINSTSFEFFAALKGAATVTVHFVGLFLAALLALDLPLVSDSLGDRFEFGHKE